jgi:hypothetical protein
MSPYAPLYMIGGLLLWGLLFVAVSDFLEWITRRRRK